MSMRWIVVLALLLLQPVPLAARPVAAADFIVLAEKLGLDTDPVWLRLLHYENADADGSSEVLSEDFFLAANGRTSARDELRATLNAFLTPQPEDSGKNARCRFPARYLWLTTKLPLPTVTDHCARLQRWARFDRLDSVSLMLVSGYFGNPASTFGHILLKINNGSIHEGYTLLDLGVNYGAKIPEGESTLVYVLRGLFGGYKAGFSDQDYYRYDLTYTRTEFRDMWEYELNLSEYQQKLLLYHLWEITGKYFRYFFLKTNCAFRIAELLELATGENFVTDVDVWYAPVSVFHRLENIDHEREPAKRLIREITYRPSAQRIYYANVDTLSTYERNVLAAIIEADGNLGPASALPEESQTAVLDVLLEYYQYRLAGILDEDADVALRNAKDTALRKRLAMAARTQPVNIIISERRPPSKGAPPSRLDIGAGSDTVTGPYSYLGFAPFAYETNGNNHLDRSSLLMADTRLAYDVDDGIRVEHFDLVRARKVNLNRMDIGDEATSSWEVALGYRQQRNGCGNCGEAFAEAAIGRSTGFGDFAAATALLGADLATGTNGPSAFSRVAFAFGRTERWGAELTATYRHFPRDGNSKFAMSMIGRWSFTQNHELRLLISDDDATSSRLYYAYRW